MMNNRTTANITLTAILLCAPLVVTAQNENLTLNEALRLNHVSSSYTLFKADSTILSIEDRQFHIQTLPRLSVSATLPSLTNSIQPITMTDGSEQFVHRYYMSSSASLSLSQMVPLTGGTFMLTGGINRLDNFLPSRKTSFSSSIFNVSYTQSASIYNSYRWDKRIHQQKLITGANEIRMKKEGSDAETVSLFFDLLAAQKQQKLTLTMLESAETIVTRAEALLRQDRSYETTLLDARIDLSKLRNNTTELSIEKARTALMNALGVRSLPPATFDIDEFCQWMPTFNDDEIVNRAIQFYLRQNRNLDILQEDKQTARLKAESLPTISLSVGAGMNSSSNEFKDLLAYPSHSTTAVLSLSIPLLNWGENKLQIRKHEQQRLQANIEYDSRVLEYTNECRYLLSYLRVLVDNIKADSATLDMLALKMERQMMTAGYGKTDFLDINETRRQIIQTENQRILKIKAIYEIVFKFRKEAAYDLITNSPTQ